MMANILPDLYVFVDESGNLDFSTKGTNHFVLSAVTALRPMESSAELQQLKYRLLGQGNDLQHFHASEDRQAVRDQVFAVIGGLESIRINYIYANKHKAHPSLHTTGDFYGLLGRTLLKYLLNGYDPSQYSQLIIVFDKALTNRDQNQVLKSIKPQLKELAKPYRIYFHHTLSDFNGQIADYTAWAKYVSLERDEQRPSQALCNVPMTSFDIFQNGTMNYY